MFIILSRNKTSGRVQEFQSFLWPQTFTGNPDHSKLERRFKPYPALGGNPTWSPQELASALTDKASSMLADSYDIRFIAIPTAEVTDKALLLDREKEDLADCEYLRGTFTNVPMPKAEALKKRESSRVEWRGDMALFLLLNLN